MNFLLSFIDSLIRFSSFFNDLNWIFRESKDVCTDSISERLILFLSKSSIVLCLSDNVSSCLYLSSSLLSLFFSIIKDSTSSLAIELRNDSI